MAQPGKVVSAQKQSARSNVEIARATKQARGLEVDAELLELRAKNAEFDAIMAKNAADLVAVNAQHAAEVAQHAVQVAALTAQNAIHENQVARQTGMFRAWGSLAVRNIEILAHKGTGIYLLVFCDLTFLDNAPLFNSIFFRL